MKRFKFSDVILCGNYFFEKPFDYIWEIVVSLFSCQIKFFDVFKLTIISLQN